MKKNYQYLTKLFNTTFKERIFILIIIVFLFAVFTLPNSIYLFDDQTDNNIELLKYAQQIDSFIDQAHETKTAIVIPQKPVSTKVDQTKKVDTPNEPNAFYFNPQNISLDSLKTLGLSSRTAQNFTKFRERGFKYQKVEDFDKIYNISKQELSILKEYALFPRKKKKEKNFHVNPDLIASKSNRTPLTEFSKSQKPLSIPKSIKIEINSASPEDWQNLHGIGPYYAKKICTFRDQLGGFLSVDQVAETYNFPDSVFQQIKTNLVLNSSVKKIPLLNADRKLLSKHPFISYKQAAIIEKYVSHRKDSFELEMLYEIRAFDSVYIHKIIPYLSI